MRRILKAAIPVILASVLLAAPVLAFAYSATFTIVESSSTDYDMFPAIVGSNNEYMAANGYMDPDALDTRVQTISGVAKPHMVADHITLAASPVGADSLVSLEFVTGETPLVSMDILSGYEGFFTITDAAALEPGDDFLFEFEDTYVNTDAGTDKSLLSKTAAFRIDVSGAQAISAVVEGTTADTFNPDAHPEGNSVDGFVTRAGAGETWPTIHDSAVGSGADDTAATANAGFTTAAAANQFALLQRGFILFDTAALPDDAIIANATVRLWINSKLDQEPWGDLTWNVYESSPATDTALVIADYNQVGATTSPATGFATALTFAGIAAGGYNTWTLNDDGVAAIDVTGISKFSVRESTYDGGDTEPSWTVTGKAAGIVWQTSEGANAPELVVTYVVDDVTITATGIASGEQTIQVGTFDRGDIDTYATGATIAVDTGAGILPVRLLEEQTLTAPAASVTFSNIDTAVAAWDAIAGVTSRHLVVVVNAFTPDLGTRQVLLRFNGDAGANYNDQVLTGAGAVASAAISTGATFINTFSLPASTVTDAPGGGSILIPHAFNTINQKATISLGGSSEVRVDVATGRWADNDAVDTVFFVPNTGNFDTGSTFQLGVVDERYLIEEQILSGGDGTFSFAGIAAGEGDLAVVGYLRSDRAAVEDEVLHEINTDAVGANYAAQELTGIAAATAAASAASREVGISSGNNATANAFGAFSATYSQFADAVNQPHYLTLSGYHESTGATAQVRVMSGRRNNVAAITQLDFEPNAGTNFKDGSMMSLYRVPQFVIQRITLAAPAVSVTFSNIPQGYESLQLRVYARTNRGVLTDAIRFTLNADVVAGNYNSQLLSGVGAVVTATSSAADNTWLTCPGNNAGPNEFGGGTITFNQYSSTTGHKQATSISGANEDAVVIESLRWEDLDPITSILVTSTNPINTFNTGSVFELVGVMPSVEFQIKIDGLVEAAASTDGVDIPDTVFDWLLMDNSTTQFMPYMGSYQETVSSVLQAWYQPIAIVANTQAASTADAGTATTIDDATLTQANDFWNGARLTIITTTDTFAPQGEVSVITDFDAALDRLTFDALTAVVDTGDTYTIDYGTLVDRAGGDNDARITWGVNPTGITVSLGSLISSSQPFVAIAEDAARDVLAPVAVSDWFGDGTVSGSTLTNPLRPLVTAVSDNTTLTELLVWRLYGSAFLMFVVVATAVTVREHLGITIMVSSAMLGMLVAFDHNIYPMYLLIIAIGGFVGGIAAERSPFL